ncbi:hypothetical protein [Vitiosangium sp. GDMCC 1.1324]|uniref:hypothetical protein n=1 Tax=Vitiosangium sp. (strain GDMCC 1.1324) TaxID=2138576 RepID=UPI000D371361|nr:hypothetical protein [Vitiosangium sp. GDMCC 1.1324]PTL84739.1 hypothetical protein DAT35_06650 [Vitiosangium sp. GDMCC 1.1324]
MQQVNLELLADVIQYLAVVLIGAFIGIGELISRYKDDPFEAIANRHAVVYTLVNVLAAGMALLALKTLSWDPNTAAPGTGVVGALTGHSGQAATRIGEALLAGFGAMSILRSSAFNMQVGKETIAIGPSALLQVILTATDRAVDRARATVRAELMAKTMQAIPFTQIQESLPQLAFSMMQNVTPEEKDGFAREVALIREKSMDEQTKSICMGLMLSNIVGQGVVDAAVTALRKTLEAGGDPKLAAGRGRVEPPPPVEDKKAGAPPAGPK